MKPPARRCLKCGAFHWGDCAPPSIRQPVEGGDGAVLVSASHPRGSGVGRGRGRLHAGAIETVEIELPEASVEPARFDKKAWMRAYMVEYRKKHKVPKT